MKKVITYGTFDLFHLGHLEILRRAKALGDYLVVAVSTDEFNSVKGKRCVYPYEHRSSIVQAIKYVDQVIAEDSWEQKRSDIINHKIDIFTMGDDWTGKFDDLADICEVIYLDRTKGISTTDLKANITNNSY
ncbi:MAG: glycerol-3-phosphate cytidylyltransferase [Candidatus Marinimicrobia bacterium]|nr:glycerol-3-phosphate cytidylyltransferase [Candidatus Neomarinimicrobiota bacterium]MCF7850497.1 glycerol-3-phosphate cytidylyltransferase [Candidatus Neomarinimicrobiota bacterium]MCF7903990.1 glycerol-3-phosphate cytidylyltransferase [Candidatus Neomarinimicrobiota bacterium]